MSDVCAIVLAGGQGTRFGGKKQFLEIKGKPLWKHVHDKLCKFISDEDIVVVGVDTEGGITRSQSVINGLTYLKEKGKAYERKGLFSLVGKERDTAHRHTHISIAGHAQGRTLRLFTRFGKYAGYG